MRKNLKKDAVIKKLLELTGNKTVGTQYNEIKGDNIAL